MQKITSFKNNTRENLQTERKKKMPNFSANARLTNHTGADLVAIPPSWEVVTKQKIAESRRKLSFYLQDNVDIFISDVLTMS